jgi:putative Mg2+ transporter-C (MgtC) family protein
MTVLEDVLESEQLPLSELKIDQFGENEVEIEAALSEASVDELDLDRVIAGIAASPAVRTAFWAARAV